MRDQTKHVTRTTPYVFFKRSNASQLGHAGLWTGRGPHTCVTTVILEGPLDHSGV